MKKEVNTEEACKQHGWDEHMKNHAVHLQCDRSRSQYHRNRADHTHLIELPSFHWQWADWCDAHQIQSSQSSTFAGISWAVSTFVNADQELPWLNNKCWWMNCYIYEEFQQAEAEYVYAVIHLCSQTDIQLQPVDCTDKSEQMMIHTWMSAVMTLVGDTVPHRWQMIEYHQLNDLSVHLNWIYKR